MNTIQSLLNKETSLAIIGLGYVGLPLAVSFSKHMHVVGYDVDERKIQAYKQGQDLTQEVGDEALKNSNILFTSSLNDIKHCTTYIVTVPTPIHDDKTPDLSHVLNVTKALGTILKRGDLVIYESTVYPGVTQDLCVPLLETHSSLKCPQDFKVGYSPERINPQDKKNTLENIAKIVSGIDEESTHEITKLYQTIIKAKVHPVSSIKVAEAAKVVENAQRDINIAFLNECAMVFEKMNIDTLEVIEAMNTKWNALGFVPGLVGGHCIGVDPYYFIYEAQRLGYQSQIIAPARQINDGMPQFIVNQLIKHLILQDTKVKGAKVAILGFTFKENAVDIRNSKVFDMIPHLNEVGITPVLYDPIVKEKPQNINGLYHIATLEEIGDCDALIFAVGHSLFKSWNAQAIKALLKEKATLVYDVKGIYPKKDYEKAGLTILRL